MSPLLEARGLSRSFGHVRALDNASFDINVGEVVALTGEHERRHGPEPVDGGLDRLGVGVRRLLAGSERVQLLEGGDGGLSSGGGGRGVAKSHPTRVRRQGRGARTVTDP